MASAAAGFGAFYWWRGHNGAMFSDIRPDLEFRGIDGKTHKLSEWSGKLLLINFWATWCAPCVKEMPLLVEAQREYGPRGLQIVGIAMDDAEAVRQFAARLNVNYPIMVGEADVALAMERLGDQLGAFPFSVLIAPDGKILDRASGALSHAELAGWVNANLPP